MPMSNHFDSVCNWQLLKLLEGLIPIKHFLPHKSGALSSDSLSIKVDFCSISSGIHIPLRSAECLCFNTSLSSILFVLSIFVSVHITIIHTFLHSCINKFIHNIHTHIIHTNCIPLVSVVFILKNKGGRVFLST
jgi:hypothetical protein